MVLGSNYHFCFLFLTFFAAVSVKSQTCPDLCTLQTAPISQECRDSSVLIDEIIKCDSACGQSWDAFCIADYVFCYQQPCDPAVIGPIFETGGPMGRPINIDQVKDNCPACVRTKNPTPAPTLPPTPGPSPPPTPQPTLPPITPTPAPTPEPTPLGKGKGKGKGGKKGGYYYYTGKKGGKKGGKKYDYYYNGKKGGKKGGKKYDYYYNGKKGGKKGGKKTGYYAGKKGKKGYYGGKKGKKTGYYGGKKGKKGYYGKKGTKTGYYYYNAASRSQGLVAGIINQLP